MYYKRLVKITGQAKKGQPLVQETEPVLWTSDMFLPSSTNIESLENTLDTVEFSVLVVTPDDIRTKRDSVSRVPRDNVIFELGLFMGRLGRSRTFIVTDETKTKKVPGKNSYYLRNFKTGGREVRAFGQNCSQNES